MSLQDQDIITLPCENDLIYPAVIFTYRSLEYPCARTHHSTPSELRTQVTETAVSLALRRWLESQQVPYNLLRSTPLTSPDHRMLLLGGRRVAIRTTRMSAHRHVPSQSAVRHTLLDSPATISSSFLREKGLGDHDLILFACILSQQAPRLKNPPGETTAGTESHWVALPAHNPWCTGAHKAGLGQLSLKNESPHGFECTLVGWGMDDARISQTANLPAQARITIPIRFKALHYAQTMQPRPDL